MGLEYLKTLALLKVPAERLMLVGRRRAPTAKAAAAFGIPSFTHAGLDALSALPRPSHAIVCVPPQLLPEACRAVLATGCRRILLEKPGALDAGEMAGLAREAARRKAEIFIAYNRRFLPSVRKARQLIEQDGGPLTLHVDFTEIERRLLNDRVMKSWPVAVWERLGIANSIHVLDLAFHLAGLPAQTKGWREGALAWHPAGACFAAAGRTRSNALFTAQAAWNGGGSWGIEIATRARRLVLRPLECLAEQRTGRLDTRLLPLSEEPEGLKPGLQGLVEAFLRDGQGREHLCSARENVDIIRSTERLLGYAGNAESRKRP